jgi:hypothetical protein
MQIPRLKGALVHGDLVGLDVPPSQADTCGIDGRAQVLLIPT